MDAAAETRAHCANLYPETRRSSLCPENYSQGNEWEKKTKLFTPGVVLLELEK